MKFVYKVKVNYESLRDFYIEEFIIESSVSSQGIEPLVIGRLYQDMNKNRKEHKFFKINSLQIKLLMEEED